MAKISTLIDDFQDNVIDLSKWTPSGTVTESGGRLILTAVAPFSLVITPVAYDLRSSQITAQVPVVVPSGTSGTLQCGFAVRLDSNNLIAFQKFGTELIITKTVAGVASILSVTPYNAVNHLYWRIRHAPNNVYMETSATGVGTFFIQHTEGVNTLFSVAAVQPYFQAQYSGFEATPGSLQIEAVNPGLQLTAAASSTSAGSAILKIRYALTASATSTSAGSAAITIPPAPPITYHLITATGTSTSSATAAFIILANLQVTAAGQSYSSGTAALRLSEQFTAVGQSFSTGTASFVIIPVPPVTPSQYFYFEPPIAYDLPPTLPHPRPRYINAHARWKGGQRRGRSVLIKSGVVTVLDTPTVDQTLAADYVYMGGHVYVIPDTEANILSAAGLIVTPIPLTYTLYPDENIFPAEDLYPGFQEFITP